MSTIKALGVRPTSSRLPNRRAFEFHGACSRGVPESPGALWEGAGVRNRGVILYTISSLPYQALSHVVSDPTGQINTIVLVTMANHATVSSGLGEICIAVSGVYSL